MHNDKQKLIVAENEGMIIGLAKADVESTPKIPLFVQRRWLSIKTIVVEGNITTPNIGLHLGSATLPVTINDVLNLKNKLDESKYTHSTGLEIIPANTNLDETLNPDISMFPNICYR